MSLKARWIVFGVLAVLCLVVAVGIEVERNAKSDAAVKAMNESTQRLIETNKRLQGW